MSCVSMMGSVWNYYGWHVFEGRHRAAAEGWRTVCERFMSPACCPRVLAPADPRTAPPINPYAHTLSPDSFISYMLTAER